MSDGHTHKGGSNNTHTERNCLDGPQHHHPATSGTTSQAEPPAKHDHSPRIPFGLSLPDYLGQLNAMKLEVQSQYGEDPLKLSKRRKAEYETAMDRFAYMEKVTKETLELMTRAQQTII